MKKIPRKIPFICRQEQLPIHAVLNHAATLLIIALSTFYSPALAATSSINDTESLCPKTDNSIRVLIANSLPMQAVAESDDVVNGNNNSIDAADTSDTADASDTVDTVGTVSPVAPGVPGNTGARARIASSLPITATPKIDMTAKQNVVRPDFIPISAFTNDEMVAPYHELASSATASQELPKRIKLDPKVARHWTGTKVEPFWVTTTPDRNHPGTYSFCSETEGGPRGWLQHTGECSAWGHPEYRYWFDPG
ncbi:MAG: hypothetical protein JST44_05860 [Cyanobacteria bacterium SZAS LIN-5]|nr:hypothetical protein [Cyanobacteria bacterium SZAS LIN-5]